MLCKANGVSGVNAQHPGSMLKEMMDTYRQASHMLEQVERTSVVQGTRVPFLEQKSGSQDLLASPASGACGRAMYSHSEGIDMAGKNSMDEPVEGEIERSTSRLRCPVPHRVPPRRQFAEGSGLPCASTDVGRLALLQCKAKSASLCLPSTVKKHILKS